MSTLDKLVLAVEDGDAAQASTLALAALDEGADVAALVERLSGAMRAVGDSFGSGEIFLPELMLAARAMQSAMGVLEPRLLESGATTAKRGIVVVGTVKGDVHEIGKDIAITMLRAAGFEVHDLGRDVNALDFVRRAEEVRADVIGASALMTTTCPPRRSSSIPSWRRACVTSTTSSSAAPPSPRSGWRKPAPTAGAKTPARL
jgi:methanogenic corrinoid protein MtbC1